MKKDYLNYDEIANRYNQRYPTTQEWERGNALLNLAKRIQAKSILEVGSGTGYWLNLLEPVTHQLFGLDYSRGMLVQSKSQVAPLKLLQGTATNLPLRREAFDLIYCVDAIHHFVNHRAFIQEAYRLLKPNGVLAIIGHDPHDEGLAHWYIYKYFEHVYDTDLRRYPSSQMVMEIMKQENFEEVNWQTVEQIQNVHVGEAVLRDPFLKHDATSQLALLSDEVYAAGIENIKRAIQEKENTVFRSEINVKMIFGSKK